jgi:hypothetical protein
MSPSKYYESNGISQKNQDLKQSLPKESSNSISILKNPNLEYDIFVLIYKNLSFDPLHQIKIKIYQLFKAIKRSSKTKALGTENKRRV